MSEPPITLEYELTQDWADALTRIATTTRGEVRVYFVLSYAAVVAVAIVVFGMVGIALAQALQTSAEGMRMIVSVAGVTGLLLAMMWTRRIVRLSTFPIENAYEVGAGVRYQIDADGIHLIYLDQDWRTGWRFVRDIKTEAEALSIRTPFAIFSMPISELPLPLDEALTRMRGWQSAAQT